MTVVIALLAGGSTLAAERIYKWTDEKGVTHYGQSIPPEYKDQAAAEMNKRGMTLRKIEPAASIEAQRKAAEEKALRDQEERKRLHEQRRRDTALINTYSSAAEIDEARDRNLALPQQALRSLDPRIKRAQGELSGLERQADSIVKSGRAVPDFLKQDMDDKRAEIAEMQGEKRRNEVQMEAIRERFEADKKRYLELTQSRPPG